MGRRRGRRTRRRRKTGRHGGFGSPGKKPTNKKKKVNRARKKLNKRIKSKTLKSKVKSIKKAVAKKKTETKKKTISASASRKQVRQKTKEKIATRKKIGLGSIGKAIGNLTKGRAAHAVGTATSRRSKLRQQLSNLRSDIAQKSTKEARFNRRADRLRNQHGLDYSRMNPSFKIDASIDQAAQKLGIRNHPLYQKYVPKDVKNWKFKYQMKAPTKLGISDGYRRPTQGGQTIAANTKNQLSMLSSIREHPSRNISRMYDNLLGRKADQEGLDYWTNEFLSGKSDMEGIRKSILASKEFQGRSDVDRQAAIGRIPKPRAEAPPMKTLPYFPDKQPEDINLNDFIKGAYGRPDTPLRKQEDWLGSFYKDFNIGGAGGKLDDAARNYWSGEAKKHGKGKVLDTIRATAKKQGTWGGRSRSNKKRRSGDPNRLVPMPLIPIPR